jgi:hypothetical protein
MTRAHGLYNPSLLFISYCRTLEAGRCHFLPPTVRSGASCLGCSYARVVLQQGRDLATYLMTGYQGVIWRPIELAGYVG